MCGTKMCQNVCEIIICFMNCVMCTSHTHACAHIYTFFCHYFDVCHTFLGAKKDWQCIKMHEISLTHSASSPLSHRWSEKKKERWRFSWLICIKLNPRFTLMGRGFSVFFSSLSVKIITQNLWYFNSVIFRSQRCYKFLSCVSWVTRCWPPHRCWPTQCWPMFEEKEKKKCQSNVFGCMWCLCFFLISIFGHQIIHRFHKHTRRYIRKFIWIESFFLFAYRMSSNESHLMMLMDVPKTNMLTLTHTHDLIAFRMRSLLPCNRCFLTVLHGW